MFTTAAYRTLLSAMMAGSVICTSAQVSIVSVTVDPMAIAPASWFQCAISNTGPIVEATFSGHLRSVTGNELLTFSTERVRILNGVTNLSARSLVYSVFNYGAGPEAEVLAREHRLSSGEYSYCIRLMPAVGGEFEDEYCDAVSVEDLLFIDPVFPFDGDTVTDVRPALTWSISGLRVPPAQQTRLVVVPNAPGEAAARSLATEVPVYAVRDVAPGAVMHPLSVPDLEPGKCYAWQVERSAGGAVIDRTEPWRFCVRKYVPPVPNKYVLLGKGTDAVYEVVDGIIYFRFDEPYPVSLRSAMVVDERGVRTPVEPPKDGGGEAQGVGINLFELDLQVYRLRAGVYSLLIEDGKKRVSTLKFRIPR